MAGIRASSLRRSRARNSGRFRHGGRQNSFTARLGEAEPDGEPVFTGDCFAGFRARSGGFPGILRVDGGGLNVEIVRFVCIHHADCFISINNVKAR